MTSSNLEKQKYGRFETLNNVIRYDFLRLKVSPSARLIWLILWRHATVNGVVAITYDRLAADTGLARSSCIRLCKELREKQLLRVTHKGRRKGDPSRYLIRVYPKKYRSRKGK